MLPMNGKQPCTSILTNVGELRSWVKQLLDDPNVPRPTFRDLCGLSEELLVGGDTTHGPGNSSHPGRSDPS